MTHDDIQEIRRLLNDDIAKWKLDVGDWIGYAEELLDEIEQLKSPIQSGYDEDLSLK